jgi:outer membrane protein assembly factor BamB
VVSARFGLGVAVLLGTALAAAADGTSWPSFRGAGARGIANGPPTPTTWNVDDGTNVAWKTAVPGLAHSSPVVWGDRIFVTTAVRAGAASELSSLYGSPGYGAGESVDDEGEHEFTLLCLDKNTGELLWRRTAYTGVPKVKRHPKSSHANPSPACDDTRVVASFGSHGLHCYDHDGEHLWSRDLGVLNSGAPGYTDKDGFQWGFASSPVLHGDRVLIQCDVENDSFLAALDANTGEDVWRVARDEDSTWGTPTVHVTEERAQVIVNGYKHMGGYDLATGTELWKLAGGGDVPVPTPVVEDGLIYITNAHGRLRPICAIRVDAAGELTLEADESEHMAWCLPRAGIYMQTPLVVDGRLYCCSDGGILGCYDAKTGERSYRERIGGGGTGFSGSAVCSGGHLYFTGESGEVFVVRAGPEFETIAVNEMGETCMSTPAISDGRLYFRTRNHLIAIGATGPAGVPAPPGTAPRDR